MAIVTDTIVPPHSYTPFEGIPDLVRINTAVPRGLVRFFFQDDLSIKPVNDSQLLVVQCNLPENFAYVFASLSMALSLTLASDWEDVIKLRTLNTIPNQPNGNAQVCIFSNTVESPVSSQVPERTLNYRFGDPRAYFPHPMWSSVPGTGPQFSFLWSNTIATVTGAPFLTFHLAFFQFDLSQAQRFPLNFPLPTMTR